MTANSGREATVGTPALRVEGLTKTFGGVTVLDNVTQDFSDGRIIGLLGPNSAGKTTLLKCVLGLVTPDAGRVLIRGAEAARDGSDRHGIGYMPQLPRLPSLLTGWELAAMLDDLRDFSGRPDEDLVDALEVREEMGKPFAKLSGGTRQKVNAALAFRYGAPILILDEPTSSLDPVAALALKAKVARCRDEGRTVLVTSHNLSDLESLADDVIFLLDGTVRFSGTVTSLLSSTGRDSLEEAVAELMRVSSLTYGADEPADDASAADPRQASSRTKIRVLK